MRILCCHSELCQDRFIGINPEENDNGWVYYYRAGGKGGYMQEKKDIEELLKSGTSVGFYPQGNSMYHSLVVTPSPVCRGCWICRGMRRRNTSCRGG